MFCTFWCNGLVLGLTECGYLGVWYGVCLCRLPLFPFFLSCMASKWMGQTGLPFAPWGFTSPAACVIQRTFLASALPLKPAPAIFLPPHRFTSACFVCRSMRYCFMLFFLRWNLLLLPPRKKERFRYTLWDVLGFVARW